MHGAAVSCSFAMHRTAEAGFGFGLTSKLESAWVVAGWRCMGDFMFMSEKDAMFPNPAW